SQINLDDYVQTGEGGTALTYNHKDGKTLAKLFNTGMAAETAEREFKVNQVVYEMGIPTPRPIRLITDGTRHGAEYELIPNKRSFTRIISEEPEQLEPLSILFAKLARELHAKEADTARLPSMKELVRKQIMLWTDLPEDVREMSMRALDTLPEGTTCLHGDLHIGNIITDGERNLWIDVGDFSYGCPEWDLCMMFYMSLRMSEQRADNIFHLKPEVLKTHWEIFAPVYYGTTDAAVLEGKQGVLYRYFALKMLFAIGKLGNGVGANLDGVFGLVRKILG
ncbi:MAG: TIGR02172 family protein, partial [Bacteroidales bacterium]|nr:TIGR02172 family protein [Bacteroidales bacterium]